MPIEWPSKEPMGGCENEPLIDAEWPCWWKLGGGCAYTPAGAEAMLVKDVREKSSRGGEDQV